MKDPLVSLVSTTGITHYDSAVPALFSAAGDRVTYSGLVDFEWEPVYSVSKHAITGFVHTLRRQVAHHNICLGAIAPGRVANELWGVNDEFEISRRVAVYSPKV